MAGSGQRESRRFAGIGFDSPSVSHLPPTVGLHEEHHFDATGHLHLIFRHLAYGNSNSDISEDTNLMAQRSLVELAQLVSR
jgi:hypothetical protein